jgi:hypothetical protein
MRTVREVGTTPQEGDTSIMTATCSGLRKRRTHRFVQIPSSTIRDKELSFRARGLLANLLDMPDGWDVRSEVLAREGREGREAIRKALHELGARGYYRLERRQLVNGTFAMGTAISEEMVEQWAADYSEYSGQAVPVLQGRDGSFQVRHKDGTLSEDGFKSPVVDAGLTGPDDDPHGGADPTGDGFSGAGSPGPGSPASGEPDSGGLGALRETDTQIQDETTSSSEALRPSDQETQLFEDRFSETIKTRWADRDVVAVCEHLQDAIVANGCKKPTITNRWRDEARKLMDLDGYTEQQVHNMIDWATKDSFWSANILSMPTLRARYDQLVLRVNQQRKPTSRPTRGPQGYRDSVWAGKTEPDKEDLRTIALLTRRRNATAVTAPTGDLAHATRTPTSTWSW